MQALYVTPTLAGYFKSSIFVEQKATAPKNGVEFRQGSIGTIRSSLATSYDVCRRRQFSTNQRREIISHRINILSGPSLRAAPAKICRLKHSHVSTAWTLIFFLTPPLMIYC